MVYENKHVFKSLPGLNKSVSANLGFINSICKTEIVHVYPDLVTKICMQVDICQLVYYVIIP